jgi:ligand-binding sensor domain-containing protein
MTQPGHIIFFRYSAFDNFIYSIAIDKEGILWIGTSGGGLVKFNGNDWTVYNSSNSGLLYDKVNTVAVDINGNIWAGSEKGLSKFDGTNWTTNTVKNSGLCDSNITFIAIDKNGNKWIGTNSGAVAVYREGGVILGVNDKKNTIKITKYSLAQNYPNPFNLGTVISYDLVTASNVVLKVYDILGREVATLVNSQQPLGSYKVNFNGSKLASGIYIYKITARSADAKNSFSQAKKMILIK